MYYNYSNAFTEDYNSYNGYLLDGIYNFDLTEHEKMILDNAHDLVDNRWSLRCLSRNVGRSRSQLSRDFQGPLKRLSYELYTLVQRTYKNNTEKYFK